VRAEAGSQRHQQIDSRLLLRRHCPDRARREQPTAEPAARGGAAFGREPARRLGLAEQGMGPGEVLARPQQVGMIARQRLRPDRMHETLQSERAAQVAGLPHCQREVAPRPLHVAVVAGQRLRPDREDLLL
jgi:hypothetical protein